MIEDPQIGMMQAHGTLTPYLYGEAYLQEDLYAEFKRIGEDAAAAATKVIHAWVNARREDLSAADITELTESFVEATVETLISRNILEYNSLPLTQDEHDEDAAHVEYDGEC